MINHKYQGQLVIHEILHILYLACTEILKTSELLLNSIFLMLNYWKLGVTINGFIMRLGMNLRLKFFYARRNAKGLRYKRPDIYSFFSVTPAKQSYAVPGRVNVAMSKS